jgi:CheY-like chemotaxis protein
MPALMQILYINNSYEDFLIVSDMLQRVKQLRCEFSFTENLEHALDLYSHNDLDLYIIDYCSAPERAWQFLYRIHRLIQKNTHELPAVLVMYGQNNQEIKQQALALGAKVALAKYELNEQKLAKAVSQATLMHIHNLQFFSDSYQAENSKNLLH